MYSRHKPVTRLLQRRPTTRNFDTGHTHRRLHNERRQKQVKDFVKFIGDV